MFGQACLVSFALWVVPAVSRECNGSDVRHGYCASFGPAGGTALLKLALLLWHTSALYPPGAWFCHFVDNLAGQFDSEVCERSPSLGVG
jgi:hypothetical protein